MADKKVILLTGEIQTGKTTTLLNWVKKREDVAGILTPVKNGKRFFYSIPEDVLYQMEAEGDEEVLKIGRFRFSAKQFEKTNKAILKWLDESQWKYLIIDEIGPLELKEQKGFWASFNKILDGVFEATVIIVVRQSLSETVRDILEEKGIEVLACSANEFQQFVE